MNFEEEPVIKDGPEPPIILMYPTFLMKNVQKLNQSSVKKSSELKNIIQ